MSAGREGAERRLTETAELDRLRKGFVDLQETLVRIARNEAFAGGDLDRALRAAVEEAARALDVERVGVWFFSPERDRIHCADLFVRSTGSHEHGAELLALDFPGYFTALEEDRAIAATDAREDPRTAEFCDVYLVPHGIGAMLDAPIRIAGRMVGVICHECVGPPREWAADEQALAATMGDFVALSMESAQRARAEAEHTQMAERLSRARKMEALARLAGSIAHDFNNLLTAIHGSLELVKLAEERGPVEPGIQPLELLGEDHGVPGVRLRDQGDSLHLNEVRGPGESDPHTISRVGAISDEILAFHLRDPWVLDAELFVGSEQAFLCRC